MNSERDSADWNCSLNFWKQPFQFRLAVPFLRSYFNGKSKAMCGICVAIFTLFFEFVQVAGLFSAGVVGIYSLIFRNRKVRSLQPWRQGCWVLSIGPQADFNRVCPDRRLGGLEWTPFPPRYCWIFHLIYIYILISLLIFISHLVLSHQGFMGGYFFLCWQRSQSHPILFVLVRGPKVRRGVPYLDWYLMWAVCCGFLLHWDCLRMSGALISMDG